MEMDIILLFVEISKKELTMLWISATHISAKSKGSRT
jgi:hypothetical protein